ncbi:hypothetical protein N0V84_006006 [Fusarium piperis]|uniref:NACHT-NTPase and P-loop NTPases N-terminal domain-containing protein n=1 Tax=Fusarium piperis TaxID=1435070 RepID=A0A9W8WCL0_9HYPO|nr:hypothetical protein N0V84_006006 [Fusarium piperis]
MSGIEIVGLVAGILPLIELAIKAVNEVKDAQQAPQSYLNVATRLPLIQEILEFVKTEAEKSEADGSESRYKSIQPLLQNCKAKAKELKSLLESVKPEPGASPYRRAEIAMRRVRQEGRLKEVMNNMLQAIQLIAAHRTLSGATDTQVAMLARAIKETSAASPRFGDTFGHYGIGPQINNTGNGPQNNNTGGGIQVTAHTITFNRDSA